MNENNEDLNKSVVNDPMMAQTPEEDSKPISPLVDVPEKPSVPDSPLVDKVEEEKTEIPPAGPMQPGPLEENQIPTELARGGEGEEPKKKKTHLIYIILAIIVIIGGIVLLVLNKKESNGSNDETDKAKQEEKEEQEINDRLNKNFKATGIKLEDGNLVVELANNDTADATADINVVFYDEEKNILDTQSNIIYVKGNNKSYAHIYLDTEKRDYDSFDIDARLSHLSPKYYKKYDDKIKKTNEKIEDDELVVSYKNESGVAIEVTYFSVLFYKNNKIIGHDYELRTDILKDETFDITFDLPHDKDLEDISYDKYVVNIDYSYKFEL